MGLIIEISPKLDIELRRESVILTPQHTEGSLEIHYDTVFAMEAGVKTIIVSERFQKWLCKQEGR